MFRFLLAGLVVLSALDISRGDDEHWRPKFDDFLIVPLRIHLLSATNTPNLTTTLTEQDIARILTKVNGVWSQAGIHFYLESIHREMATNADVYTARVRQPDHRWLPQLRPPDSIGSNLFNVYYVKQFNVNGVYFPSGIFVKDTASLRPVPGGIDEPLPRVTSHELGHALSLPHRQSVTNLLASGTTGTNLNSMEIQQSRSSATNHSWIESAPALLKRADELHSQNRRVEAAVVYRRLADIPIQNERVQRAKLRAR
jgi:hypothetical protein